MPELPELEVYRENLAAALIGRRITGHHLLQPFTLRTVDPPLSAVVGAPVLAVLRRDKHLALQCGPALFLIVHLMVGGRLHLVPRNKALHRKLGILALEFDAGPSLHMTEAGTKKRATLHAARSLEAVARLGRGVEPLDPDFTPALLGDLLQRENAQLKRALTDPTRIAGIGNAYSDEILFAARLSPLQLTRSLDAAAVGRLHACMQAVLRENIQRIREIVGDRLPTDQQAFRRFLRIHGKTGQPCPACGDTIRETAYAERSLNYCPTCQHAGRPLADRRYSKFLK